jgi:hypothetical protein
LAREDATAYQREDQPRIEEMTLAVPRKADRGRPPGQPPVQVRRVPQRGGWLQKPKSRLCKVWARRQGYSLLAVETPVCDRHTRDDRPVPLRRYVISVLPDSGLSLEELGAALDELETQRRQPLLADPLLQDLDRGGRPPRPGFTNSDPWYDGRSAVLAHTIVDAPRQGSVLAPAEVRTTLERLYGSANGPAGG